MKSSGFFRNLAMMSTNLLTKPLLELLNETQYQYEYPPTNLALQPALFPLPEATPVVKITTRLLPPNKRFEFDESIWTRSFPVITATLDLPANWKELSEVDRYTYREIDQMFNQSTKNWKKTEETVGNVIKVTWTYCFKGKLNKFDYRNQEQ
ncbi:MAG: hypothetical protein NT141_01545 [candidate division WWE3 bacterium]|nr:hypothetical protein [candidate division WWE3 bacterium]